MVALPPRLEQLGPVRQRHPAAGGREAEADKEESEEALPEVRQESQEGGWARGSRLTLPNPIGKIWY
jgi:hypothetical protein